MTSAALRFNTASGYTIKQETIRMNYNDISIVFKTSLRVGHTHFYCAVVLMVHMIGKNTLIYHPIYHC